MASIMTGIQLQDNFSKALYQVIDAVNLAVSAMVDMQDTLDVGLDMSSLEGTRECLNDAAISIQEINAAIEQGACAQRRFNDEIDRGANSAGNLGNTIKGAVSAYAGIAGIRKAVSWVDECTDAFDMQRNAEMQLMTVLANTQESAQDSFSQILDKAAEIQSLGIYGDEAMIGAAAEFSTYFTDTDAIEMMMDTLTDYAMGMSGGGEIDTTAMVQYATNLGKIMSGSYQAMTEKGFKFTEAQQAIIEGTASQEQIVAALGEEYLDMSADMQAAAAISQVIGESWDGLYASMSNTPEGKIMKMTNAWGDMKEVVGGQLYPYVILFVDTITNNWGTIETVINNITGGLQTVMGVLSWLLDGAMDFAGVVIDNWSWISPIIYGIVAALAVYGAYLAITKGLEIASAAGTAILTGAKLLGAAAMTLFTGTTWAAATAQMGLNSAMYACPIVWIIILIIALIAVIMMLCNWIAEATGAANSGIGIIVGALSVADAFVKNLFAVLINTVIDLFATLWNFIATFVNFFGNVFIDPVGAIARLFGDLFDCILGLLQTLAGAIDTIFGSNLSSAVQGWRDSLSGWVDEKFGQGTEIMAKISSEDWHVDRFEYGEAWDAGVAVGDGISDTISNCSLSDVFGVTDLPLVSDYTSGLNDALANAGVFDNLDSIAADTAGISDSLDISAEDLKYLRDLAEQEAINRFTTAEINVEMHTTNTINKEADLDGIVDGLTKKVLEGMEQVQEGA